MARMAWDTRRVVERTQIDPAEREAGMLGLFGAFCFLVILFYVVLLGRGPLDASIIELLRGLGEMADPSGTYWVDETARALAPLGGAKVLGLVVAAAVMQLLATRGWGAAALLLVTVCGGVLLAFLLKLSFGRPGSAFSASWVQLFSTSFPSANAVLSAMVYPTLGAVLAVAYASPLVGRLVLAGAALLTLLVGTSRAYISMHLPTDVLAGWSVGLAWAALCWIVVRRTRGWGRLG
jgi:undecaprenyl-diphosphatase